MNVSLWHLLLSNVEVNVSLEKKDYSIFKYPKFIKDVELSVEVQMMLTLFKLSMISMPKNEGTLIKIKNLFLN